MHFDNGAFVKFEYQAIICSFKLTSIVVGRYIDILRL